MRIQKQLATVLIVSCIVLLACGLTHARSRFACDEPDPASLCTADNTCGSATNPCTVNITKSGSSANVRPSVPNARNNQLFCVKKGTTVIWMTSNRNTGFMISFGTDSPFIPDDPIIGGANKQVTVKANTPGCFRYDAGAFFPGAIFGMSGGTNPELIILP